MKRHLIFCITFASGKSCIIDMNIDLQKGVTLRIQGELGKHNSLPVSALVKIAEALQGLVSTIVEHDIPTSQAIDLNNFQVELSHFGAGSAMPTFELTPRVNPLMFSEVTDQRERVSARFDELMSISDKGGYTALMDMYPTPAQRNAITESLYNFTKSFGDAPVEVGMGTDKKNFKSSYKIIEFKAATKKELISEIIPVKEDISTRTVVARVKKGKRNSIIEEFDTQRYVVAYQPTEINANGRIYTLKYPLCCTSYKEDDYYVIENKQLDLIGTGLSRVEAEDSFNWEFDYAFVRFNELSENQLSRHFQFIKAIMCDIVKDVR